MSISQSYSFPIVEYGCEIWTIKKAEHWRINAFELWCWRRLLRVPGTTRRSNQSIQMEIDTGCYWKDWCWSWNSSALATWCEELTHWKRPWSWERVKVEEGDNRNEMVGWHHQFIGPKFEWALRVGDEQGSWCAAVRGVTKSRTWLSDWTEQKLLSSCESNSVSFSKPPRKTLSVWENTWVLNLSSLLSVWAASSWISPHYCQFGCQLQEALCLDLLTGIS